MTSRCSRRTALKLLAGTAVGAGLPWLRSPSAGAQSSEVPKRILFIDFGSGNRRGTFEPAGYTLYPQRDIVTTDWAFRDVMSSLSPYRDRATMFHNLDMLSQREDKSGAANAHIDGATHALSADSRHQGSDSLGMGPSIDQYIAQQLAQSGVNTRLQSLELYGQFDGSPYNTVSYRDAYSAPGQKMPFICHAPDAWNRIFPDPLPDNSAEQARLNNRRNAAYNLIRSDYDRLLGRVSGEDRNKLMQMRDYRADLQASLLATNSREANRPSMDALMSDWSQLRLGRNNSNASNPTWRVLCETMARLAAAALHTDTTRVVNLAFEDAPDYEYGYTAGNFGSSDAHDLTHQVSGDRPMLTDPAAAGTIDALHSVMYRMVRFTLDELASLTETDGKSLLDHTLVVLYSHIGEGSHDCTRLPWVVFGDAQGYLKAGQYIQFAARDIRAGSIVPANASGFNYGYYGEGRAHNDLFVTLANAMGIQTTTFGNATVCKGAIEHMIA